MTLPDSAEPGGPVPDPLPLLDVPADGVPPVISGERALSQAAQALASGHGPVAIDAERASGYRYGQRAYLVQLRRAGAGTHLVDPIACPDLSPLDQALEGVEWVVHAATQDLPCLAELRLRPTRLFDTELGARLAGLPRVGLAAVVGHYLGLSLAKEHSAVDWSTRPLPDPWLRYAALDVEVLVEVRDAIENDLAEQDKLEWAREEFQALTGFTGPPARPDPWRRTSGMHKVRNRRTAAAVRELWYTRDRIARDRDIAAGRILPDAILLQLALAAPSTADALVAVSSNRAVRRHQTAWLKACRTAADLPETQLPAASVPADGPPPIRTWSDRDPVKARQLAAARADLARVSAERNTPVENLLSPDTLRRLVWEPPEATPGAIAGALTAAGARRWQVTIATPVLLRALGDVS